MPDSSLFYINSQCLILYICYITAFSTSTYVFEESEGTVGVQIVGDERLSVTVVGGICNSG